MQEISSCMSKIIFGSRCLNQSILLLLKGVNFYCCSEIKPLSPYFYQGGLRL